MHQLFVDGQAARGIKHIDVIATKTGLGLGAFGDGDGIFAFDNRQGVDADLVAEDRQLFHRGGAVHVKRGHQHAFAVFFLEPFGEFGGCGGLTAALQADHQDRRWRIVDLKRAGLTFALQHVDQGVVDNFDDLLTGGDGFGDGLTCGLILHRFDKIAGDGQRYVCLKQGHTHLAQGGFDIVLGQGALFGQAVKDTGKAFAEIFKHGHRPFRRSVAGCP